MWDMNEGTEICYLRDYVYRIKFDDGSEGEVDLIDYLGRGPVFNALTDLEIFKQARIEGGTITWPNGADIAPETLYEMVLSSNKQVDRTH